MKILFSHPTGNQNVRHALAGFVKANSLHSFHTSIALFEGKGLYKFKAAKALKELQRRRFNTNLYGLTNTYPFRECGRLLSNKFNIKSLVRHEQGYFCVDQVYQALDKRVAAQLAYISKTVNPRNLGVYCYEDGAYESFKESLQLGINRYYDLPIGYWRLGKNILEEASERWPQWAGTLHSLNNSDTKLSRKDAEISMANNIIVASSFTAHSLSYFPGCLSDIKVIPYGFPPVNELRTYHTIQQRPLRVLYVGSLSQRKGIAEMFHAVVALGSHIELTVIGKRPLLECKPLDQFLRNHKWIPSLPHPEILHQMAGHDVLIFPSLFEGFGLVITEAMSQGTPVITTTNTAGPDLIDHNIDGWIVEPSSVDAIKEVLEQLVMNRDLVIHAGQMAKKKAAMRQWIDYSDELSSYVLNDNSFECNATVFDSLHEHPSFVEQTYGL